MIYTFGDLRERNVGDRRFVVIGTFQQFEKSLEKNLLVIRRELQGIKPNLILGHSCSVFFFFGKVRRDEGHEREEVIVLVIEGRCVFAEPISI